MTVKRRRERVREEMRTRSHEPETTKIRGSLKKRHGIENWKTQEVFHLLCIKR